jgi:hypothetical protein
LTGGGQRQGLEGKFENESPREMVDKLFPTNVFNYGKQLVSGMYLISGGPKSIFKPLLTFGEDKEKDRPML